MLWLALLGAKASLPQHVPLHADNLEPHPKEGAKVALLHCCRSNPLSRPVHDLSGSTMENGVLLHLFTIVPLVPAPVNLIFVARVVIVGVNRDITHIWILGGGITFIDGSEGRNRRGSRQTHLCVI